MLKQQTDPLLKDKLTLIFDLVWILLGLGVFLAVLYLVSPVPTSRQIEDSLHTFGYHGAYELQHDARACSVGATAAAKIPCGQVCCFGERCTLLQVTPCTQ